MTETNPQASPPAPSPSDLRSSRQRAVVGTVVFLVLALLQIGFMVASYLSSAPLRGDGLVATPAVVTDFDYHRRSSDEVTVRYDVPGQSEQQADIRVSRSFDEGEIVQVAYSPDEPGLVRTVEDWAPRYSSPWEYLAAGLVLFGLGVCLVGVARPATMPLGARDNRKFKPGRLGMNWGIWIGAGVVVVIVGFFFLTGWLDSMI